MELHVPGKIDPFEIDNYDFEKRDLQFHWRNNERYSNGQMGIKRGLSTPEHDHTFMDDWDVINWYDRKFKPFILNNRNYWERMFYNPKKEAYAMYHISINSLD